MRRKKSSFNGAADFHRRKCCQRIHPSRVPEASMGPPIFIGGNQVNKVLLFILFRGFNGAADFHRRK